MNISFFAAATMGALGAAFGLVLSLAYRSLKVEEDPRVEKMQEILPGVNCGACGFASCHAFAEAIVAGKADVNACRAGGETVAAQLAGVMGVAAGALQKKVAVVHCGAKKTQRKKRGNYRGAESCAYSVIVNGGEVVCPYGCLGLGECKKACPFGAIEMRDGLPVIIPSKCTACGKCVQACPRHIISIEDYDERGTTAVLCSSLLAMKEVKAVCSVGCIGCGVCAKLTAKNKVFSVVDNLARLEYNQSVAENDLTLARSKCPTGCIVNIKESQEGVVYTGKKEEDAQVVSLPKK